MYCCHCGKEIADEALMCPNCGAPTKNSNIAKQEETVPVVSSGVNINALSVAGLILSVIAFATGIVFEGFLLSSRYSAAVLLYIIGEFTILPAFAGLSIGAYVATVKEKTNVAKNCAICSIVFASVVLFFLFATFCAYANGSM